MGANMESFHSILYLREAVCDICSNDGFNTIAQAVPWQYGRGTAWGGSTSPISGGRQVNPYRYNPLDLAVPRVEGFIFT